LKNYDGIFSVDTLPSMLRLLSATPILRTCRVDIGYMLKTGVENISNLSVDDQIRFFQRYLNRHCSSWIFNNSQLQRVASKFCRHDCIYFCL